LYGELPSTAGDLAGSEAICHNKVIEDLALPGQLVIGTDSHTCMAGVLGCLAFGVGSTDMANAWYTRDVRITVPETVRIVLHGGLRHGVCAKDVMLRLLASDYFKDGGAIGKVLEFSGTGLATLCIDERSTLTNMSVEAGAFTGIMHADAAVVDYLSAMRGLSPSDLEQKIVEADPDARYAHTVTIDLGSVEPMVATPGDPRNGIELSRLLARRDRIAIDIAYGGSCTGGKRADMDMYAAVLRRAVESGDSIAAGVRFYIQFGSRSIAEYAERQGYVDLFRRAGAELVGPSCGACIRAGPGISSTALQTTISAVNRNFPGRSGPGKVYLASPLVVAASAIAGEIAFPEV
jgi:3-isopropylmalate/(R)-2-methylmalate dehydratase large subunit